MGIFKKGKSGIKKTGRAGSGSKKKITSKGGRLQAGGRIIQGLTGVSPSDVSRLIKGRTGTEKKKSSRKNIISKRAMKNIRRVAGYRKQLAKIEKVFNKVKPISHSRAKSFSSEGAITRREAMRALAN